MKDQDEIQPSELTMDRRDILAMRLQELRRQHRALDEDISGLSPGDSFSIRRLKKQKLALKDDIARIEDQITPDIIA